jgi:glycosyltransferase involved in cell wall biosynthesis
VATLTGLWRRIRRRPVWRVEGPFDSSYSLALVNRHLALALDKAGVAAELFSTEGPGDFPPNAAFLERHPAVRALWERGRTRRPADAVLRNLYPPRVTDMIGDVRVLASYGWEESAFPPEHVEAFNRHLDLVTTVSTYVATVLIDNGVAVQTAIVGDGLDHWAAVPEIALRRPIGQGTFRFLHVSSCLPRKGVDALLAAWGRAFTTADEVCLVIKTSPNPHNDAAGQIAGLARSYPHHAEIVLIEDDFADAEMAALYRASDAVVMPSRGEGFGLPIGEAMWFERPVLTTAYGGQMDFCDESTAWLVDYRFAPARTHFALANSVWADPDIDDLTRGLRRLRDPASATDRQTRAGAARRRIERDFTWDAVARRTIRAVKNLPRSSAAPPVIAWIAPRHSPAPAGVLRVFPDDPEPMAAIRATGASQAVIADVDEPAPLLDAVHSSGITASLVLSPGHDASRLVDLLAPCRRVAVASVADLNRLKDCGLAANSVLLAEGMDGGRRLLRSLAAPAPLGFRP